MSIFNTVFSFIFSNNKSNITQKNLIQKFNLISNFDDQKIDIIDYLQQAQLDVEKLYSIIFQNHQEQDIESILSDKCESDSIDQNDLDIKIKKIKFQDESDFCIDFTQKSQNETFKIYGLQECNNQLMILQRLMEEIDCQFFGQIRQIKNDQFQCQHCSKVYAKKQQLGKFKKFKGGHISKCHKGKSELYHQKLQKRETRVNERIRNKYIKQLK